jgi:hypothetical protein
MTSPNSIPSSTCSRIDPRTIDYCNAICTLVFSFLGLMDLTSADWFSAGMWLSLGVSCALVIGLPNYWRENWTNPRSLASSVFFALAVALLLFAPPFHHHASLSTPAEKADYTYPGNK